MLAATNFFVDLLPDKTFLEPARRAHKLTAATLDNFARVHLRAADRFRKLNLSRIDALYVEPELLGFAAAQINVAVAYTRAYSDYAADLTTTVTQAQASYLDLMTDWGKSLRPSTPA